MWNKQLNTNDVQSLLLMVYVLFQFLPSVLNQTGSHVDISSESIWLSSHALADQIKWSGGLDLPAGLGFDVRALEFYSAGGEVQN